MILFSILLVSISGNPFRGFKDAIGANVQEIYDTFIVHDKLNMGMPFTRAAKTKVFQD